MIDNFIRIKKAPSGDLIITYDVRWLGLIFVIAGIVLVFVGQSDPEMPAWFGLLFIGGGALSSIKKETVVSAEGSRVVLDTWKFWFLHSSRKLEPDTIADVTADRIGNKGAFTICLHLLNGQGLSLGTFSRAQAMEGAGLLRVRLGLAENPESAAVVAENSEAEVPNPKAQLKEGVKRCLVFCLITGALLAALSPYVAPLTGEEAMSIGELRAAGFGDLLDDSNVPLPIQGITHPSAVARTT